MSEIGDMFKATKEQRKQESRERRAANAQSSAAMLVKNGLFYTTNNDGVHLIITNGRGATADFWPSTGKFNIRGQRDYHRGVRLLIKKLKAL